MYSVPSTKERWKDKGMQSSDILEVKPELNQLLMNGTFKAPLDVQSDVTAYMLGKIVDKLFMTETQDIIRESIRSSNDISIVALVDCVPSEGRDQLLSEIASMSNNEVEQYLLFEQKTKGVYLFSAHALIAKTIQNIRNDNKKKLVAKRLSMLMWEQLMYQLGKREDLQGYFGADISPNIVLMLAKQRTELESSYLSEKDIQILQKIATEMNAMYSAPNEKETKNKQILNLSKEDLVCVITNINKIARDKSKKKIASCLKQFDNYKSNRLVTESPKGIKGALSRDYVENQLGPELSNFAKVVSRYNDVSNYFLADDAPEHNEFCNVAYHDQSMPDCSTTIKRLHVYALKLEQAANNCNTVIEAGEKANLKERYASGNSSGLIDRGRGWYHSR
jgi:hypothetical protein